MDNDATIVFDVSLVNNKVIKDTIKEVAISLKERGYNPINQLVGYLMTGDLGYISSYNNARNKISKIDRSSLLEIMLRDYLK